MRHGSGRGQRAKLRRLTKPDILVSATTRRAPSAGSTRELNHGWARTAPYPPQVMASTQRNGWMRGPLVGGVGALGTGLHHLRSRNGSSSAAAGREQRCFDARDRRFLGARESEAAKWNRVDAVRSSMQVADERARARAHFHGAAQARHGVLHGTARTCADQDSEYGRRRDALDGSGAAAMRLAPRVAVVQKSIILGGVGVTE